MSSPIDPRSHLRLVPPDGGRRVLHTEGDVGGLQYEAGLGISDLTLPSGPDAQAAPLVGPSPAADGWTDGRDTR